MLVLKIILYVFAVHFYKRKVPLSIIKGKHTKYNKMYEISLKVLTLGENSGPLISEVSKLLILCIPHSNFSNFMWKYFNDVKKNFWSCQNGTEF